MKIGIVGNTCKPKAVKVIEAFLTHLRKRNVPFVMDESLLRFLTPGAHEEAAPLLELGRICSVMVVFGGDGTMLATAREIGLSGIPILGVNIGTLGFLAEVMVEEIEQTVDALINEHYTIVDRMVLRIDILREYLTKTFFALNDVVLDKGLSSRLIFIDTSVNGAFLNSYRADGLIVATPTGSTAYSMSAGGPLMMPKMHAFIVTPICPHSLTVRPIVLSDDSSIELSIRKEAEPVQVNIDGQNRYKLLFNEKLCVTKAKYCLRWISIGKRDFFQILRAKLNWGSDNHEIIRTGRVKH
jgi:NAD+ kinase